MSLLLDTDVTLTATQAPTVTLLLGLQQLTSVPPNLANKDNNRSGSSTLALSMGNDTQVASMSLSSFNLTTSSMGSGAVHHSSKKGVLLALYMAGSVLFASVL